MSSNFVLALPTAQDAYAVTPSADPADDFIYGYQHLLNGPRYAFYKLAATSTSHNIVFDFGDQGYSADYMLAAQVSYIANPTSIALAWSDDNSSYTTVNTMSISSSSNYRGRHSQDQWESFTEVTNKRYWRVSYATSSASSMIHSKLYFGQRFDFGVEPSNFVVQSIESSTNFLSENSTMHMRKNASMRNNYTIEFQGVTDAVLQSFKQKAANKINAKAYGLCAFLLTQTDHQLLADREIAHVNITDFTTQKAYNDYNVVSLTCEELL